jgi:endogenous inhibitor of DNA gyrase (YacG/DUF329 family)
MTTDGPDQRTCPICGNPLPPPKRGHDHRPMRTYCSRRCAADAWKRSGPPEPRVFGAIGRR